MTEPSPYASSPTAYVASEKVGAEDVTITLPTEPGPGSVVALARRDTTGTGALIAVTGGEDCFGRPGGPQRHVVSAPMGELHAQYARVPVREGSDQTAGVWYVT